MGYFDVRDLGTIISGDDVPFAVDLCASALESPVKHQAERTATAHQAMAAALRATNQPRSEALRQLFRASSPKLSVVAEVGSARPLPKITAKSLASRIEDMGLQCDLRKVHDDGFVLRVEGTKNGDRGWESDPGRELFITTGEPPADAL